MNLISEQLLIRSVKLQMKAVLKTLILIPFSVAPSVWAAAPPVEGGVPGGDGYDSPAPIPPEKLAISPGGVDMRSGTYKFETVDISIGGEGEDKLALVRSLSAEALNYQDGYKQHFGEFFTHNWAPQLVETRIPVLTAYTFADYDYQVSASFGGLSDSFRSKKTRTVFNPSSLNTSAKMKFNLGSYEYTANDGTIVKFRPMQGYFSEKDCIKGEAVGCVYASKITKADGTEYVLEYDSNGLPNVTDQVGNVFPPASSSRLRSVTSNKGFALLFEYNAPSAATSGYNLIAKTCALNLAFTPKPASNICPANAVKSTYVYNGASLIQATDTSGSIHKIENMPGSIKLFKPAETVPFVTTFYNEFYPEQGGHGSYRVASQQFTDGTSYTYQWNSFPDAIADGLFAQSDAKFHTAGGTYTDATGKTASVIYRAFKRPNTPQDARDPTLYVTPGPVKVIDQLGRTTTGDYCNATTADPRAVTIYDSTGSCFLRNLKSWTDPEGNIRAYSYDAYKNIVRTDLVPKPGSALPTITTKAGFTCAPANACNKPASITDARGAITTYTYSTVHGGMLTETGPIVNGVAPQKRHEYAQRYAWIKNASNTGYVQAASPVWVKTKERTCKATASSGQTCAGGAADETITEFEYGPNSGPNNLLLRGVSVTGTNASGALETQRTCYAYDDKGNKISETSPLANLAICP